VSYPKPEWGYMTPGIRDALRDVLRERRGDAPSDQQELTGGGVPAPEPVGRVGATEDRTTGPHGSPQAEEEDR
jgi:hypothetical protein